MSGGAASIEGDGWGLLVQNVSVRNIPGNGNFR